MGSELTIELSTADGLSTVEGKHLRAKQVLSACETSGKLELVGHVGGLHNLVGPLAVDLVELVDLEPAGANTGSLGSVVDRSIQEMSDRTRVTGGVPLNFDGVALGSLNSLNTRWHLVAIDVAGHIVRLYICDRTVGGRHPDADLVARGLIIDPELVEVLVGRDGRDEGGCDDSLGEHLGD